jgi:glucokinase
MQQQEPSSASGSPQEILTVPETGYVVGADIGGTSLRLALAGMDGEVLAKWKVSTAGIRDPEVVVRLIREGVEDLLQQRFLSRSSLRAVAAGAPGVTDVDAGVVLATS